MDQRGLRLTRNGKERPEVGEGMDQRGLRLTRNGKERPEVRQGMERSLRLPGMEKRSLRLDKE